MQHKIDLNRYLMGLVLTAFGAVLLFVLGQPVWSLLPAISGVYILGSTLWDTTKK
jgi:hypothetical protein